MKKMKKFVLCLLFFCKDSMDDFKNFCCNQITSHNDIIKSDELIAETCNHIRRNIPQWKFGNKTLSLLLVILILSIFSHFFILMLIFISDNLENFGANGKTCLTVLLLIFFLLHIFHCSVTHEWIFDSNKTISSCHRLEINNIFTFDEKDYLDFLERMEKYPQTLVLKEDTIMSLILENFFLFFLFGNIANILIYAFIYVKDPYGIFFGKIEEDSKRNGMNDILGILYIISVAGNLIEITMIYWLKYSIDLIEYANMELILHMKKWIIFILFRIELDYSQHHSQELLEEIVHCIKNIKQFYPEFFQDMENFQKKFFELYKSKELYAQENEKITRQKLLDCLERELREDEQQEIIKMVKKIANH